MKFGNEFWLILIWEYIIPKFFTVCLVARLAEDGLSSLARDHLDPLSSAWLWGCSLGCQLSLVANSKPWDTPPGIVMVELQRLPVCCGLDTHTSAEIPRPATPSLQPASVLTHYQPLHLPQVLGWLHLSHRIQLSAGHLCCCLLGLICPLRLHCCPVAYARQLSCSGLPVSVGGTFPPRLHSSSEELVRMFLLRGVMEKVGMPLVMDWEDQWPMELRLWKQHSITEAS